jgi:ketosteroid isomerase-like protein
VGPDRQGLPAPRENVPLGGQPLRGGQLVAEHTVVFSSGDLAYTVGFERGDVTVDDGPARTMTIRVTHTYRRYGDAWRLVHRHADFPPPDQRRPVP